eukprot:NODE_2455_length_602_cov_31.777577_g2089_i0.p3 GENE.NODE_2455_length_602_cov_31.777577_g2089_i0~~NODE_2455_length_602_cov_31.777577_g2089_i0.p3  ORF type:complete len:102 (+),score=44.96 NODE_2455_length_602_cov_31.777577_g2089_i0:25-306(+)
MGGFDVIAAPDGGCKVINVSKDGPSAGTGIEAGDVLTHWNGEPLTDRMAYATKLLMSALNSAVTLQLKTRGGDVIKAVVTVGRTVNPAFDVDD